MISLQIRDIYQVLYAQPKRVDSLEFKLVQRFEEK